MGRSMATVLLALVAAGCQRQPPFEEQYNETARTIDQRAAALDAELDNASDPSPDNSASP